MHQQPHNGPQAQLSKHIGWEGGRGGVGRMNESRTGAEREQIKTEKNLLPCPICSSTFDPASRSTWSSTWKIVGAGPSMVDTSGSRG